MAQDGRGTLDASVEAGALPLDVLTMQETARRVLLEPLSIGEVEVAAITLRGHIELLVADLQALILASTSDTREAQVARVGLGEAQRRLTTPPGLGDDAHRRHAKKLAMSVVSLCGHYENLRPRS
jgi:hypothetical protein